MARYELTTGTSSKFWAIDLLGSLLTTTYGKTGKAGRKTVKEFDSDDEAARDAEKLVRQKLGKGYVLVDDSPGRHGARYFELVDGKSSKFWEVLLEYETLEIRYGKIGKVGRFTYKDFDTVEEAKKQRDKLIASKKDKGYVEQGVPAGGIEDARNPELEAAIFADPEDDDAYAVLADWLQAEGDPRGELIALELAGETKQARACFKAHEDYFLGPLEAHQKVRDRADGYSMLHTSKAAQKAWNKTSKQAFLWRRGYIHRLRLSHVEWDEKWDGRTVEVLDEVLEHPSGRFIVEFSFYENGKPDRGLQEIVDLLAKKAPASTRKITFGDSLDQISWHHTGSLAKLWKRVPELREIEVQSGHFEIGKMVAPALERAVFITGGLKASCARAIARAKMPNIQHLEIYYGSSRYGSTATLKDVHPLLARTDLTELRYLGIENTEFSNQLPKALAKAKVLAGLETLSLAYGTLTDEGAEALAAIAPALEHLQCLDLTGNYLTKRGIAAVEGLCEQVITRHQDELEEWDFDDDEDEEPQYYVSVSE